MPASFVVTSGPERVVVYADGDSALHRSPTSSGGTGSISSEGSSWSHLGSDDIDPSDSASRSRQPASRRHTVEAHPAPVRRHSSRRAEAHEEIPTRRQPARRQHSSRHESRHESRHDSRHDSRHGRSSSRRVPSDESSSTVASADDFSPYGPHGMPRAQYPPPQSGYRHVPAPSHGGHPGYPPSMAPGSAYPDPYGQPHQALVHMRPDPFGYPQPNPFSPQSQHPSNPFSPMSSGESSNYFSTDPMAPPQHHRPHRPEGPPRPQSFAAPSTHFPGSELMAPYQQPPMNPYGGFGIPGYPPYPAMHAGWPPSQPKEAPRDEKLDAEMAALKALLEKRQEEDDTKKKEKSSEMDALKELIKKHEEERVARETAWIKEREAEAAAKAAEKARAEEEKKRKAEIDDVRKKAKEDAEKKAEEAAKKAKEEHEKKLSEAEKAKEEADKAKQALEEEIAKNKPTPDSLKAPIKFKDAVGRKFSFPWHICKTWKGMETLIKQAFLHVDLIGDHVHQGHYDLTGPDGEIILPQVWDTMVQPDWEITMHLWPMEEEKKDEGLLNDPFSNLDIRGMPGLGDFGGVMGHPLGMDGGKKKAKKGDGSKKKKGGSPEMMNMMPPPPPQHPGMSPPPGPFGDPFAGLGMGNFPPGISAVPDKPSKDKTKARAKSKSSKEISPLAAWFAGGSITNSKPKKDDEKLEQSRAKSHPSAPNGSTATHHDQANCVVM